MSSSEQKRAILAVVLSGLTLFVWQAFFAPKQPVPTPNAAIVSTNTGTKETVNGSHVENKINPTVSTEQVTANSTNNNLPTDATPLTPWTLTDGVNTFTVQSNLEITHVTNSKAVFPYEDITGIAKSLKISILTTSGVENIHFTVDPASGKLNDRSIIGNNQKYGIEVHLNLSDKGLLNYQLKSRNPYRYRISMASEPGEIDARQVRNYIYFSDDVERIKVGDAESGEGKLKWFGVDHHYHFAGFVFQEKQNVTYKTSEKETNLVIDFIKPTNVVSGDFVFVKKNYDTLKNLGNQLDLTVDFGVLGIIAVPMLRSLQWIYKYVPNYGLALIVLTLFIRMLLFPLSFTSFKSMKKMQKIQPELTKLKEKFKDDPPRMQKETMELFKRAGANPLGGCLPMLMQMPIFFAFYKVLYGAVELVGAPFFGWIHDLSIKDPFYVLPVIMALSMFAQQKLTPSTSADPTQQKVMMFMPLIFGFIMKDLPAGLNLYIAVSTLFGIGQQLLVYKITD